MAGSVYVMSATEIAFGYVFGHVDDGDAERRAEVGDVPTPRVALESVVRRALERPPCGVAFSGGRDSSAVLAVATHVARRDGLAEPVPITRRFPDAPETDEREWQEAVIAHLGLRDWERVEIHDELDVVGPLAARHLRAHGVVWPPAIASDVPLVEAVPGGSVLDGEGGDQVLGVDGHRIAPISGLLRSPRPLRRRRITAALWALAPPAPRGRRRVRMLGPRPWLRPASSELLAAELARAERSRPLSYAASVQRTVRRRDEVFADANRRALARARGVELVSPLLDARFVDALAADGGRFGRGSRTDVLRALVPDLLPDAVLNRRGKAVFNAPYMTVHARSFAARWSGQGLDHELVDADALRDAWLADRPIPATAALLQAAWLADRA